MRWGGGRFEIEPSLMSPVRFLFPPPLLTKAAACRLITVWLQVRILPGPPRTLRSLRLLCAVQECGSFQRLSAGVLGLCVSDRALARRFGRLSPASLRLPKTVSYRRRQRPVRQCRRPFACPRRGGPLIGGARFQSPSMCSCRDHSIGASIRRGGLGLCVSDRALAPRFACQPRQPPQRRYLPKAG